MPSPDITSFVPKYIQQTLTDVSRATVTAARWNELWNLIIEQGDWNSEAIDLICEDLLLIKDTTYTQTEVDAFTVKLTGNQTIAGVKTFSSSPIVPAPTTDLQAATKKYVDDGDAALTTHKDSNDHDERYYTKTETVGLITTGLAPQDSSTINFTVADTDLSADAIGLKFGATNLPCSATAPTDGQLVKRSGNELVGVDVQQPDDSPANGSTTTPISSNWAYDHNDASSNQHLNILTTRGDVVRRGATVPERLALGTAGKALVSDGTDVVYGYSDPGIMAASDTTILSALTERQSAQSIGVNSGWKIIDAFGTQLATGAISDTNYVTVTQDVALYVPHALQIQIQIRASENGGWVSYKIFTLKHPGSYRVVFDVKANGLGTGYAHIRNAYIKGTLGTNAAAAVHTD